VDQELNAWATAIKMIKAGVRPPVVHLATGLPQARLRELYQQVHGRPAPRGRVPLTAARQIKSVTEAMEAMLFARLYLNMAGDAGAFNGHMDSSLVIDAYHLYVRTLAGQALDVTLAWYLARDIRDGAIKVRACPKCKAEYLYEPDSPFLRTCHLCRMRIH